MEPAQGSVDAQQTAPEDANSAPDRTLPLELSWGGQVWPPWPRVGQRTAGGRGAG